MFNIKTMMQTREDKTLEIHTIATVNTIISNELMRDIARVTAEKMADELRVKILESDDGFKKLLDEIRSQLAERIFSGR